MGVTLSKSSIPKLRQAIADGERYRLDRAGERLPAGPVEGSFHALITGVTFENPTNVNLSPSQVRYVYSFIRIMPAADADADLWMGAMAFKLMDTVVIPRSAIELNNRPVGSDEVVLMNFVGLFDEKMTDEDGNVVMVKRARYGFVFQPEQIRPALPIHDHRDNITGGGFAFAVYHPGTALPQQPWAL